MSRFAIFFLLCFFASIVVLMAEPKASSTADHEKNVESSCLTNKSDDDDDIMAGSIGAVIDESSRVGKEQRIAVEMAVHDFNDHRRSQYCSKLLSLHFQDSQGNSDRAASAVTELVNKNKVDVILGQLTFQEATLLLWDSDKVPKDIPMISMAPLATSPPLLPSHPPSFISMSTTDINFQMQSIAAVVGHFRWRKIILIYESGNSFSADLGLITALSNSLQVARSAFEYHVAFPRVGSSHSSHKKYVEEELSKLRSDNVKVFVVLQASLEFSTILFEKAKELRMMETGYVWIVSDDVANLLDSAVDSSVVVNYMQGVIGLKMNYLDTTDSFRAFELRFRQKYRSEYPEEEKYSSPSLYALRAYDAAWAIAKAIQNSEENEARSRDIVNSMLSIDFEGLSGTIRFKNGALLQNPVYQLVNVIGKSYRTIALLRSHKFGFSKGFIELDGTGMKNGNLGSIYWPGGESNVPLGLTMGSMEKPLIIGVAAKAAFKHFVNVTFDQTQNKSIFTGFSIQVFKAAIEQLHYRPYYKLVQYNGWSYDEMVKEVHSKSLDAIVGDISVVADRYEIVDFTQPYLDSGIAMIVPVKPDLTKTIFLFLKAFELRMWIVTAVMTMCTGVVVWLNEHANNNPDFQWNFPQNIGSMLWFSVTVLSFTQRESIRSNLSRLALAAWFFVTSVVTACFTASVTSMMTVPRNQPSIADIDYLLATNAPVGCNRNGFVCRFLIEAMHFNPENVKGIGSISEYPGAFRSGHIKAAFFIAPHAKIFLAQYCKGYTIAGPNIKLGGLAFAFQKGSPFAVDFSEAILKLIQSRAINEMEDKMLKFLTCSSSTTGEETHEQKGPGEIGIRPFFFLFLVSGGLLAVAFLNAIVHLLQKHYSIYEYSIQALLILNRRVFTWASLLLHTYFTKFRTTIFRVAIIQRPNNEVNMTAQQLEQTLEGHRVISQL